MRYSFKSKAFLYSECCRWLNAFISLIIQLLGKTAKCSISIDVKNESVYYLKHLTHQGIYWVDEQWSANFTPKSSPLYSKAEEKQIFLLFKLGVL